MIITSAHGGGGRMTSDLIRDVFEKQFANETLSRMEDAAVLPLRGGRIAFTTDSFVVTPLFFPGGDIGRLSVCGTVNDLLMRGATPKYLSAGFILEEGLDTAVLEKVAASMRAACDEAGVSVVAGDTKVVEGNGGLYINTSGIGVVETALDISVSGAKDGDAVIVSGTLGDHHAVILTARLAIENEIQSDCAPLSDMVGALLRAGIDVHALRDVTRGGLATVLGEIAAASGVRVTLSGALPVNDSVRGFCDILGLDPLYMGNEGKMVVVLPEAQAETAVAILRGARYGENAAVVGRVRRDAEPGVFVRTSAGSTRRVGPLAGEGLPRIC